MKVQTAVDTIFALHGLKVMLEDAKRTYPEGSYAYQRAREAHAYAHQRVFGSFVIVWALTGGLES